MLQGFDGIRQKIFCPVETRKQTQDLRIMDRGYIKVMVGEFVSQVPLSYLGHFDLLIGKNAKSGSRCCLMRL